MKKPAYNWKEQKEMIDSNELFDQAEQMAGALSYTVVLLERARDGAAMKDAHLDAAIASSREALNRFWVGEETPSSESAVA